jgi:hypothetical protein
MLFAVAVMDPTIKMLFYAAAVALFVLAAIGFERGQGLVRGSRLGRVRVPVLLGPWPRCGPACKMPRMPLSGVATRVYGEGDT